MVRYSVQNNSEESRFLYYFNQRNKKDKTFRGSEVIHNKETDNQTNRKTDTQIIRLRDGQTEKKVYNSIRRSVTQSAAL